MNDAENDLHAANNIVGHCDYDQTNPSVNHSQVGCYFSSEFKSGQNQKENISDAATQIFFSVSMGSERKLGRYPMPSQGIVVLIAGIIHGRKS